MKSIKILWAAMPLLLLAFSACNHDDDNNPNGGNNVTPSAGTWQITYFFDKQDETANYADYRFIFGNDGSLTASKSGQNWTGTWQTGTDDSTNKFVINFGGTVPSALSELAEDWRIITVEDSFMHFEHTSGGNGDTDVVKFTKI